MPASFPYPSTLIRSLSIVVALALSSFTLWAQKPPGQPSGPPTGGAPSSAELNTLMTDVDVAVRDLHGSTIDAPAMVHIHSETQNVNETQPSQGSSKAHFSKLSAGEYEVEVTCPGYQTNTERVYLMASNVSAPLYIYMVPEGAAVRPDSPPSVVVMTQQLRAEMEKGFEALNKNQYESARKIFTKALLKAPGNPDINYFLGVAELGLQHLDLAKEDFRHTLSLDPNHELALVSLAHVQLASGATGDAILLLEKAVSLGHANWRALFELASAYFKANRLTDAELEASRAAHLAKEKGAPPTYLLGEIQYAEGKPADARRTWQSILSEFPSDPIVPETKKTLTRLDNSSRTSGLSPDANFSLPPAPEISLVNVVERPWAPPDIDAAVYDLAPDVNCKSELILDSALRRLRSEMIDFEKFTATEHIEHQEIDRYGLPGPTKTHDFSYIVFVHPFGKNSFYLEESRDVSDDQSSFPAAVTTTGLNSLGVSVLQPIYRERFNYSCEGLSSVRGQAAWQVRFEEKPGAKGDGVRRWHRGITSYEVPIKGRLWISSLSFAVLRIESDLRDPVAALELTKDHILVDYGPVNFTAGNVQLWLPWSADMYLELRGKRYHHRHFLSDYMLFGVDTNHKIEKPAAAHPPPVNASP